MPVLMTNVTAALKKVILPYIQNNLPKNSFTLDKIKKDSETMFMNDTFYSPVRTGRHSGIVNLANDGNSLVSGSSAISQATISTKLVTGTFDISDLVIKATSDKRGAVENQLMFQVKTLVSDLSKDLNRQVFSDGVGAVAQVLGSVGAGTLTVMYPDANLDDGRSIDWYGTVNGDISPTKYLSVGQAIGIGTAGADVGTITSINNNTVVVTGAPAIAANDTVYKVDGSEQGAGTSEIQGFRAALSSTTGTSTYAGLARSNLTWTPQFGSTAETLTLSSIETRYIAAREFANVGDKYYIFMNKTLYKKYGDLLTSMRRNVNKLDLQGGWSGLEFVMGDNTVAVVLDYDCPDGEVIIVNMDTWKFCQVGEMDWLEDPDGSLIRRLDSLKYQATMVWYGNMMCVAPAANARATQKTG